MLHLGPANETILHKKSTKTKRGFVEVFPKWVTAEFIIFVPVKKTGKLYFLLAFSPCSFLARFFINCHRLKRPKHYKVAIIVEAPVQSEKKKSVPGAQLPFHDEPFQPEEKIVHEAGIIRK